MTKYFAILVVAGAFVLGGLYLAQAQTAVKSTEGDARLDKIIEQNELILKNQAEMKKQLEQLSTDLLQLRRRSS
jgi:hypothetical protein